MNVASVTVMPSANGIFEHLRDRHDFTTISIDAMVRALKLNAGYDEFVALARIHKAVHATEATEPHARGAHRKV